jgi:hypothetical protein
LHNSRTGLVILVGFVVFSRKCKLIDGRRHEPTHRHIYSLGCDPNCQMDDEKRPTNQLREAGDYFTSQILRRGIPHRKNTKDLPVDTQTGAGHQPLDLRSKAVARETGCSWFTALASHQASRPCQMLVFDPRSSRDCVDLSWPLSRDVSFSGHNNRTRRNQLTSQIGSLTAASLRLRVRCAGCFLRHDATAAKHTVPSVLARGVSNYVQIITRPYPFRNPASPETNSQDSQPATKWLGCRADRPRSRRFSPCSQCLVSSVGTNGQRDRYTF